VKPAGNLQAALSISRPVSLCELRAASYLASAIGNGIGCAPALESDAQVREQLDFVFDACTISSAPCFRRFSTFLYLHHGEVVKFNGAGIGNP
jgi:hypothetical protein